MIKSVLLGAVTWEILVASRVISPSIGAILVEWFMLPPANAAFYTTPHHQYPQLFR